MLKCRVENEIAQLLLGQYLAGVFQRGEVVFLYGSLGAGKTTLVRGLLRGLGYTKVVKSPTYSLIESYQFADKIVYHLDLYRLVSAEEMECLGAREYFHATSLCLIEWPEQGGEYLPVADWKVRFQFADTGRYISIEGNTINNQQIREVQKIKGINLY